MHRTLALQSRNDVSFDGLATVVDEFPVVGDNRERPPAEKMEFIQVAIVIRVAAEAYEQRAQFGGQLNSPRIRKGHGVQFGVFEQDLFRKLRVSSPIAFIGQ